MGNCVSSQGQSSALEKQAATARSKNILAASRKVTALITLLKLGRVLQSQ